MARPIQTTILDLARAVYEAAFEEVGDDELAEHLAMLALAGLLSRATLGEPGAHHRAARRAQVHLRSRSRRANPLLRAAS